MPIDSEEEGQLHEMADILADAFGIEARAQTYAAYDPDEGKADWRPAPRPAVTPDTVDIARLKQLLDDFDEHLAKRGVDLSRSVAVDALAAYLSCQFLLIAGPSGTGKSTLARALASFFCDDASWRVIEARRQLIGSEDIAGYLSPLAAGKYLKTQELKALLQLAVPGGGSPAILVEEINLSPIEGYLGPFTHGLSGVANEKVPWSLHEGPLAAPPGQITFEPFPRMLGTINVDATAPAPAPKVAGRASVVLLDAHGAPDVSAAINGAKQPKGSQSGREGSGAPVVGNPAVALATGLVDEAKVEAALDNLLTNLLAVPAGTGGHRLVVSRRQLEQVVVYAAWFVLLGEADASRNTQLVGDPYVLAVENAVLHHYLPSVAGRDLGQVLNNLTATGVLLPSTHDDAKLGPLLSARVDRLQRAAAGSLIGGQLLDFWERLS